MVEPAAGAPGLVCKITGTDLAAALCFPTRDQSVRGFPTGIPFHVYLKWGVKMGSYLGTRGGRRKLPVS